MKSNDKKLKIFFLHNPKAGGYSISEGLRLLYAPEEVAPIIENAPQDYRDIARKYQRFRGYNFYAGHYGYCVFEQLNDNHLLVTNFRDPIARIVSLYGFWRNNVPNDYIETMAVADAACVQEAKQKDFSEFIRSDNVNLRLYLDNAHYRQIRDTWFEKEEGGLFSFLKVVRRMLSMQWYFFAEYPTFSRKALHKRIPEARHISIERLNVTKNGLSVEIVPIADLNYLTALNRKDVAIYKIALFIQACRIRRWPRN